MLPQRRDVAQHEVFVIDMSRQCETADEGPRSGPDGDGHAGRRVLEFRELGGEALAPDQVQIGEQLAPYDDGAGRQRPWLQRGITDSSSDFSARRSLPTAHA